MKIAIIGAGISGLTTYLALQKHLPPEILAQCSITIYEKHDFDEPSSSNDEITTVGEAIRQPKNVGVGIGIQPNGMRILHQLDPDLHDEVVNKLGFPLGRMVMKTEGGYEIANLSMEDVQTGEQTVLVSRLEFVRCLQRVVVSGGGVVVYRDVQGVVINSEGRPKILFGDGDGEVVDLIIGADGIKSVVREVVIGDDSGCEPVYDGYCGVGGILEAPVPSELRSNPAMVFTLSSTGVFGYSGINASCLDKMIYWSLYDTDLPSRGKKASPEDIIASLRARHGNSTDPLIRTALEKAKLDTIWPVFLLPKLPRWGRNGCVLVGDAAHALPPNSGQGASQGIEDAHTFALLLSAHLQKDRQSSEPEIIEKTIEGYFKIREPRVDAIRMKALRTKRPKSDLSWGMTMTMYAAIWVMSRVEWLSSFVWSDPIHTWRAEEEVEKVMADSG